MPRSPRPPPLIEARCDMRPRHAQRAGRARCTQTRLVVTHVTLVSLANQRGLQPHATTSVDHLRQIRKQPADAQPSRYSAAVCSLACHGRHSARGSVALTWQIWSVTRARPLPSAAAAAACPAPGAAMRCHYEVLDVARDAEASAIRKAYHRAALQHHPDKSTAADAEERFREVQAAYEILSVPAERAWCVAQKRRKRAALLLRRPRRGA